MAIRTIKSEIKIDATGNAVAVIQKTTQEVDKFNKKLQESGSVSSKAKAAYGSIKDSMMPMFAAVSLVKQAISGLSSVLTETVGSAAKLETEFKKMQNLTKDFKWDFSDMRKQISDLSMATGRSSQTIASAMNDAISSGSVDNVTEAYELVSKAVYGAIGTFSTLPEAIDGANSAISIFGKKASDTKEVIAKLNAVADFSKAKFADSSRYLGQFGIAASSLGVTFEESIAGFGVFINKFRQADVASTNLTNVFLKLQKPTETLKVALKNIGYASSEAGIKAEGGFLPFFNKLIKAIPSNITLMQAFEDQQAALGAQALSTASSQATYVDGLKKIGDSLGALDAQTENALGTTEERWTRVKNSVSESALKLGNIFKDVLAPVLSGLAANITTVADVLERIKWKNAMIAVAGLTAVIIAYNVATGISATTTLVFAANLASVATAAWAAAAPFVILGAQVALVVGAFVGAYAVTRAIDNNLSALGNTVMGLGKQLLAALISPLKLLEIALGKVFKFLGKDNPLEGLSKTIDNFDNNGLNQMNKGLSEMKMPDFTAEKNILSDIKGLFIAKQPEIKIPVKLAPSKNNAPAGMAATPSGSVAVVDKDFNKAQETIDKLRASIADLNNLNSLSENVNKYNSAWLNSLREIEEFKKTTKDAQQIAHFVKLQKEKTSIEQAAIKKRVSDDLEFAVASEVKKEAIESERLAAKYRLEYSAGLLSAQQLNDAIEKLNATAAEKALKRDEEDTKKRQETIDKILKEAEDERQTQLDKIKTSQESTVSTMNSVLSTVKSDAGGLVSFIAGKFGFIGQIIGGIWDFLRMPKDEAKKMASSLLPMIMEAVDNVIANVPTIVEKLIASLGTVIPSLIRTVISGSQTLMPTLISGIFNGITDMIASFGKVETWKNLFAGLIPAAINAFKGMGKSIANFFSTLFTGKKKFKVEGETAAAGAPAGAGMAGQDTGGAEFAIRDYQAGQDAGVANTAATAEEETISLSETWDDLLSGLTTALDQVWGAVKKIGTFLNEWLNPVELTKTAVEKIGHFFGISEEKVNAIKGFINDWLSPIQLVKDGIAGISAMFEGIKNSAPFQAILIGFDAFIGYITMAWNGFKNIFNLGNIWQYVVDTFNSFVGYIKTSWNILKNDFTFANIWLVLSNGFDALKNNIISGWNTVKQTLSIGRIWDAVVDAFNSAVAYISGVWEKVKSILKIGAIWDAVTNGFNLLVTYVTTAWTAVKNVFNFGNIWETITNTFNSLITYVKTSWNILKNNFSFSNIWIVIQNGWDSLKANVLAGWATIKSTLSIDRIWDAISTAWDTFKNKVVDSWSYIKSVLSISNVWSSISSAWDIFSTKISSGWAYIKSIFTISNIWASVQTGFNNFYAYISTTWESLKSKFTITNPFTAISESWDKLVDKIKGFAIDLKDKFSLTVDYKGKGTVENFLGIDFPWAKFADGGVVGGTAVIAGDSEKNDKIPALLSAGEFVVPRSVMGKNGVPELMQALMRGDTYKYAQGGIVKAWSLGRITKAIVSGGASEVVRAVAPAPVAKAIEAVATGGVSTAVDKVDEFASIRSIFNTLNSVIGGLDIASFAKNPAGYIGDIIKSAGETFFKSGLRQVIGFADGGYVPGFGSGDSVPAMLTPGELVLNRQQQQQLSSGSVTINLNISAGAVVDKPAIDRMLPQIIEGIRRASVNGQSVLSTRGIR